MADWRHARGLIDTSVVVDLDRIEPDHLPAELAVSAVTMAELAAGLVELRLFNESGRLVAARFGLAFV